MISWQVGKNETTKTNIPSYLWKEQPFQGEHKDTTKKYSPENVEVAITFYRLVLTVSTLEEDHHFSPPEEHGKQYINNISCSKIYKNLRNTE